MTIPKPLRILYDAWMKFAHVLGRIMSFILLTILWIVGFGLYAIPMKIISIFKRQPNRDTYWVDVPPKIENDMKHQF
jgi:hypothetical protein